MRYILMHTPRPWRHFFFGDNEACLANLRKVAARLQPDIEIAGTISPPFRPLTDEDEACMRKSSTVSRGFRVGCLAGRPHGALDYRQPGTLQRGVFLAVGDAFTLLTGRRQFAPALMQRLGLTWLYRLCHEPIRLGPRYLHYNLLYLYYAFLDRIAHRSTRPPQHK